MTYVVDFPVLPSDQPTALVAVPPPAPVPDLDGLPEYELAASFTQRWLRTCAAELQRVEVARREVILNFFPPTAGELLAIFESLLGLPVAPPRPVPQRAQIVMGYMQSLKSRGTGLQWEQDISNVLGSQWAYREHDPADSSSPPAYTVQVFVPVAGVAAAPSDLAEAPAGSGSLVAGTYRYAVTATTVFGETTPSPIVTATLTSVGGVGLTWTTNPAPTSGYNVYRGTGTSGPLMFLGQATAGAFTDDGSLAPSSIQPPTTNTTADPQSASIQRLLRLITPAHLALDIRFSTGFASGTFIVGISHVGDPL